MGRFFVCRFLPAAVLAIGCASETVPTSAPPTSLVDPAGFALTLHMEDGDYRLQLADWSGLVVAVAPREPRDGDAPIAVAVPESPAIDLGWLSGCGRDAMVTAREIDGRFEMDLRLEPPPIQNCFASEVYLWVTIQLSQPISQEAIRLTADVA